MLPLQQAYEVKQSIIEYLKATFNFKEGEVCEGKKVNYEVLSDKCDRVEDYKVAWTHFEKIFNQK